MPSTFPTASAHADDERRPDGIAVDLTSEPPSASVDASTEDKVVTLQTPLGGQVALASVRAFFNALEREDVGGMMTVLDPGALLHDTSAGSTRPIHSVTSLWRQRFNKHEYQQLSARLVYREADVTTYRGDQLAALPLSVRDLSPPPPTSPTDLVLRVPIVTHSIKSERVFGDEIFFWLRRVGDRFEVYRMAEDVPL